MPNKDPIKRDYSYHKYRAMARGIEFHLTLDEWLGIWLTSGHFHERGKRKHQYVMARFGDCGPYAIGNVKIIMGSQNRAEQKFSAESKEKMRLAKLGKSTGFCHRGHPRIPGKDCQECRRNWPSMINRPTTKAGREARNGATRC